MFCNMWCTLPPECVCNYNQTILLGVNMNLVYEYLCVQEKYRRHYFASTGTKTLN